MKVAAIQMVSGISLDANLSEALRLLRQAAAAGAELAVLPEYFCFMGQHDADKLLLAEQTGLGTVQDFLSDAARDAATQFLDLVDQPDPRTRES